MRTVIVFICCHLARALKQINVDLQINEITSIDEFEDVASFVKHNMPFDNTDLIGKWETEQNKMFFAFLTVFTLFR